MEYVSYLDKYAAYTFNDCCKVSTLFGNHKERNENKIKLWDHVWCDAQKT